MLPVTRFTAAIQSFSSWSVSFRVMSHTARTPWAPWKYASLSSSRNPFSPMMSQIVMSIAISPSPLGLATTTSIFDTFAPRVEMYRSSNWSWMNRRIRHVFPTAPSPTRHTLTFIFCRSAITILSRGGPDSSEPPDPIKGYPRHYLYGEHEASEVPVVAFRDRRGDRAERALDVLSRLRADH